ncbi:hypothetical protein L484_015520 [Morus notabilis]|uniref:Uncharacterized protein n=1 Tax=Morus notabilis TaxID=981085 RepID=W9RS33_9ROSA|nr:hypothetical protein L484_015520 [Morus notabilis]
MKEEEEEAAVELSVEQEKEIAAGENGRRKEVERENKAPFISLIRIISPTLHKLISMALSPRLVLKSRGICTPKIGSGQVVLVRSSNTSKKKGKSDEKKVE